MLRWSWFVLVLGLLLSVGCGGQSTPDPEPQNANRPGKTADKKKAADRGSDGRKQKPPPPSFSKVIFLVRPLFSAYRNIQKVEIEGDPKDKQRGSGYQIKNVRSIAGLLPTAGSYYLRQNIIYYTVGKTVEQAVSTDPDYGPLFDTKLPAGVLLVNAVFLGKCKADVEGWTTEQNSTGYKDVPFNVYEAVYEKR